MDLTTFRATYPEFPNVAPYADATVTRWLGIATSMVNPNAWGELTDFGVGLFTAHNLVIAGRRSAAAGVGAAPGETRGVVSAKAVDKVSQSFDTATTTLEGAGNWNATDYGVQFWQYAQMFGSGGMQLC